MCHMETWPNKTINSLAGVSETKVTFPRPEGVCCMTIEFYVEAVLFGVTLLCGLLKLSYVDNVSVFLVLISL